MKFVGQDRVRRYEEAYMLLKELERYEADKPIVVEGIRDKEALRALGLGFDKIVVLNGGKSSEEVLEWLEVNGEVIVLTDFDSKGAELAYKIKRRLEPTGVKVDLKYWHRLRSLLKCEVKDVESLTCLLRKISPETLV